MLADTGHERNVDDHPQTPPHPIRVSDMDISSHHTDEAWPTTGHPQAVDAPQALARRATFRHTTATTCPQSADSDPQVAAVAAAFQVGALLAWSCADRPTVKRPSSTSRWSNVIPLTCTDEVFGTRKAAGSPADPSSTPLQPNMRLRVSGSEP